jgi:hypothetical protein
MTSAPLVNVEIGGREYDGDVNISRSFRIQENNVPALEKKLTEWSEELGP